MPLLRLTTCFLGHNYNNNNDNHNDNNDNDDNNDNNDDDDDNDPATLVLSSNLLSMYGGRYNRLSRLEDRNKCYRLMFQLE